MMISEFKYSVCFFKNQSSLKSLQLLTDWLIVLSNNVTLPSL